MKRFFKFMTIGAIMVSMFASCSEDKIEDEGSGGGIVDGGEAYFSFNLIQSANAPDTRAETEAGTETEREVNDVVILLYDDTGADATLRYKFELDAYNEVFESDPSFKGDDVADGAHVNTGAIGKIDRFVSVARKVRYQDYQMVVLLNYQRVGPSILARKDDSSKILTRSMEETPDLIRDRMVEDVSRLSDINDVFDGSSIEYYKNTGFFMSNANGIVPVSKTQLKDTKEAAETDPVQVNVDRLLAKVRLYTDFPNDYQKIDDDQGTKYITPAGLTITDVKAYLNVTNRNTYLIRQYANYADANAGGTGLPETYATSVTTSRRYIYAQDFNFNGMSSTSAQDLEEHFNKVNNLWEFSTIPVYDIYDLDESYGIYVLENTMSLADQAHANYLNYTTHYLIRAILFPKGFTEGSNYYSYTNLEGEKKVFTHEEALDWLDDDKFPFDMTGLKAILTAINSDPDELDFNPSTTYPDSDDWSADDIELLTEKGITYHPGGLNIYAIPIKHFQPTGVMPNPRNDLYGYYGVVRNNVYNVRITSIDGPGTGGSGYISADITVNEWYIRDQEEDI